MSNEPGGEATGTVSAGGDGIAEEVSAPVVEYRVMQGTVVKNKSVDPAVQKFVKLKWKVGAKIKTTGTTWQGAAGGWWVEVASREKPGWFLLEGPGFGLPGPLLQRVEPDEGEPLVLFALSPVDDSRLCDFCVMPHQTVKQAKSWVALHLPGLKMDVITVAREKPSEKTHGMGLRNFPASWIIADDTLIKDTPFKDGDEFVFFYMGDAAADVAEEAERRASAT
mmetsp:Transcript_13030/g.29597  ORF Transcript_13030/g.29597 Transcript_13030/m.29597 type:complete len:223 (-) Transcript_13030:37-705(-)